MNQMCGTIAKVIGGVCAAFILSGIVTASSAQDKAAISFELNNARQTGKGCRLSFVVQNGMPAAIEALALEIVLFNKEGLVDQFLKLKAGALPMGKTRVKQFVLKGKDCGGLSKILINEIAECKGEKLSPTACMSALSISSRTPIKLKL